MGKKLNKNIGLFGSSFNPPHRGHEAVLSDLLRKNLFDEIWLIPVFMHPFNKDLMPFDTRLLLATLLAKSLNSPKIRVSTIERELGGDKSFAYDVVCALKEKNPSYRFTLIIGSDVENELSKWRRIAELKKLANFHVIARGGEVGSPYPKLSSTEIRHKNIYLAGFMAAGKTEVGKRLAKMMSRRFVDTDKLIEQENKKTITQIFTDQGETHFRALERQVLQSLSRDKGLVVSLGGGVPFDNRNQKILRDGLWFFLDVPLPIICKRLARSQKRPLAKDNDEITRLYAERLPIYQKATHIIDCQARDPDAICEKILEKVVLA